MVNNLHRRFDFLLKVNFCFGDNVTNILGVGRVFRHTSPQSLVLLYHGFPFSS